VTCCFQGIADRQSAVAFAACRDFLIEAGPFVLGAVMGDLQSVMAASVNSNRVFLPGMSTATRLLSDEKLATVLGEAGATKSVVGILTTGCRGIPQIKSIDRITGSLKL